MRRMLMSPRMRDPFSRTFSTPPSSKQRMAFLMYWWPWMLGASELASCPNTSWGRVEIVRGEKGFHPNRRVSISVETYFAAREGPDFGNVACWEDWRHFLAHLLDVAGNQDGPERKTWNLKKTTKWKHKKELSSSRTREFCWKASPERARSESPLLGRQAAVGPDDLHAVSRFDHVHQVVVQDDVHRAGQLASGGLLWHLLHGDGLVVLIDRQTKLCLQRVVLFILAQRHGKQYYKMPSFAIFTPVLVENKHDGWQQTMMLSHCNWPWWDRQNWRGRHPVMSCLCIFFPWSSV